MPAKLDWVNPSNPVEQFLHCCRIQLRRRSVRKPFLLLLLCLSIFSLSAFAEEWNKSYQVGDKPSLHVDTNDASVEIYARSGPHRLGAGHR